jgi:branched-chain amino acid transport system permease protein
VGSLTTDVLNVTTAGITTGCLYGLLVLGIVLTYQVGQCINFAYGQVGMIGAFSAWYLATELGWPTSFALLAGLVLAVAVSASIDVVAMRHIPEGRPGFDFVVTLGIFLLLTSVMQQLIDSDSHSFTPLGSDTIWRLGDVVVNLNDIVIVVLLATAVAVALSVLRGTSVGVSLRGSALDPVVTSASGVNVRMLRTATWAIAGGLTALAAALAASRTSVDAFYMTPLLIKAFIAAMIGGLDRLGPSVAAAVLLGVYESVAMYVLGPSAGTPAVFGLIIILLAVVPKRFVLEGREVRA